MGQTVYRACFSGKYPTCKELADATYENAVPYIVPLQMGKVVKVYDGDTITVVSKFPNDNKMYRFSVRLRNVDTPEMTSHDPVEKEKAIKARDALHGLIMGKIVLISNTANEKYGRILADIWIDNTHVNKWLIKNKYGVAYDGGTKQKWNVGDERAV